MPDRQCARCGRVERLPEADDALRTPQRIDVDNPEKEWLTILFRHTWAPIDGDDVCPECQSDAERTDVLTRRVISAVEGDISRNTELGADPLPFEDGLVTLAMQLREALWSREKSASTGPTENEPQDRDTRDRPIELDVAITGAFLTGRPLHIAIGEYPDVRLKLATKLAEHPGRGWQTGVDERRAGTYSSGGGFSSMLPLVVACREGDEALARTKAIWSRRPKNEDDWLQKHINGWSFEPISMQIDVYDLGVAVINGTFAVGVPAKVSLASAASALKRAVVLGPDDENDVGSPITSMFRTLSKETTEEIRASIDATVPKQVQRSWLPRSDSAQEWGRLLWLHPVHLLEIEDPALRRSSAKQLSPTFRKSVDVMDGRFVSGIGWSAIVTGLDPSARGMPMRLLMLHWAYFALYMEIDRGLLAVLDRSRYGATTSVLSDLEDDSRLSDLEEHAKSAFGDYIRVMKARARVDTALASLGGDEQAIWDVIAGVQKFDALVSGVDRKVDALQKIAERRVQQASAASARRTAKILGFLTTLALVTLAIAAIGYFFGGLPDTPQEHKTLRIVVFVVGVVFAVVLWCWIFDWRPWPRRTSQRDERR